MNLPDYIEKLQEKGRLSFTLNHLLEVFKEPKASLVAKLYYLRKKGRIVSPLQGFYIIIPLEDRFRGSLEPQDMIVLGMQHLDIPYYAGLLTAASYHGASHQATQRFQVITNKRIRKPWIMGRVGIEFIYKKDIKNTEIEKRVVSTGYLHVSTPEETAKDIMIYYEKSGGLNHQATILSELTEAIDTKKLVSLAKKSGKLYWVQRMGYILENIDTFYKKERNKVVSALEKFLETQKLRYVPLAPEMPKKDMPRNEKWRIIENAIPQSDI